MSNTTVSKNVLISGLNNEIASRLSTLKSRVLSWHEHSGNAEIEMQNVITASIDILDLMRTKTQLLDSKKSVFNFPIKNDDGKKAPVENTKKAKRKR